VTPELSLSQFWGHPQESVVELSDNSTYQARVCLTDFFFQVSYLSDNNRITIRLSDGVYTPLVRRADVQHTTVTNIVRRILEERFAKRQTEPDSYRKHELAFFGRCERIGDGYPVGRTSHEWYPKKKPEPKSPENKGAERN
jgi:hypothetical protein